MVDSLARMDEKLCIYFCGELDHVKNLIAFRNNTYIVVYKCNINNKYTYSSLSDVCKNISNHALV